MNAITPEIMIPALTSFSVIAIGASVLVSRERRTKLLQSRLQDSIWAETHKVATKKKSTFIQLLEKIGNFVSHGHASTSLWEQLARAGYLGTSAPAIYTGIKMILFVVGSVAAAVFIVPLGIFLATKVTLIFLAGLIPFFIPNLVIWIQLKKRHDEICHFLPDAVDLLEICVSSGIGLDMAWNMVADQIQHVSSVLASAMALTNFEIHLGASRAEAMRHMAERTGVDELTSLAAILIQTDRFGTSLATTLKVFAASMREERSFTAEENAEKMAVKLIIPMVVFIFPAVVIIVTGPAIISIAKVMLFGG